MATAPAQAPAAPTFKKLRQVTLAVLKLDSKAARYLYIVAPMHISADIAPEPSTKKADPDKPEKKRKEPATVAHAIDMQTGEEGVLICSAMLKSQLNREYPGERYVGKGFELVSTKVPDKDYNIVGIAEVEVPEEVVRAGTAIRAALKRSNMGAMDAAGEADAKRAAEKIVATA